MGQRATSNLKARERWQRDEIAHLKERFVISPLPAELEPLLEPAVAEWTRREALVCPRLGMSAQQFLAQFESVRSDFLEGKVPQKIIAIVNTPTEKKAVNEGERSWQECVTDWYPAIRGAVQNLEWVNVFAWILPRAAHPMRATEHRVRGQMVA